MLGRARQARNARGYEESSARRRSRTAPNLSLARCVTVVDGVENSIRVGACRGARAVVVTPLFSCGWLEATRVAAAASWRPARGCDRPPGVPALPDRPGS